MISSPVQLKTRRVGERCTLNLSRAQASFRWCGLLVRRGGCQFRGVALVTSLWFKITRSVAKRPRVVIAGQVSQSVHLIQRIIVATSFAG
ncbi:hypothetical protein TNCV_3597951 [Trichonephila clavipes]|nr:hypothetical protein TNCV_3597951 [Trichonephila clavipes]